jgi:hypothetical protein
MKVRVCPNCGKHNDEGAFSCADCGTTLSLKTLMDTDSGQLLNVKPIAGYTELAKISPYFERYILNSIKTITHEDAILWVCNITHVTNSAPFMFGYLILSSRQLICTYFESDSYLFKEIPDFVTLLALILRLQRIRRRPERNYIDLSYGTLAVNYPDCALTEKEEKSRVDVIHDLKNLDSIDLVGQWYGGNLFKRIRLKKLIPRFQGPKETMMQETTIDFYSPADAEKAYKVMTAK